MSCLMEGCTNTKRSCKSTSIVFFGFPNIPAMRAKWIWACNIKTLPKKPSVCSQHFLEKDIMKRNEMPRLHRDAFPLPPEGSHRRKIALGLRDSNTLFIKRNNGIVILNPNETRSSSNKRVETCGVIITEVEQTNEVLGGNFELVEGSIKDEEIQDLEFLDIERLDKPVEEYLNTGSEDEEINVPVRTNQYFKCCVTGCTNTSTNSDIKFYKFRTDEFSRSRWCENISMKEELVHSNTKICANHFVYPNDFKGDGNLKAYAAPSVNIPGGPILIQHIMPVRARKS